MASEQHGVVRMRISGALLRQMLHMPEGIFIADVEMPYDSGRETIELLLVGPDFPPISEGEQAPLIDPTMRHTPEKFEWDWHLGN